MDWLWKYIQNSWIVHGICIAVTGIIFCSFHFHFILISSFAFTFSKLNIYVICIEIIKIELKKSKLRTIIKKKHKENERKERGKGEEKDNSATIQQGENSSLQSYVLWAWLVHVATGTVLMRRNSTCRHIYIVLKTNCSHHVISYTTR